MVHRDQRRTLAAASLVGLVALVPFLRGLIGGRSFYFRDLSLYFFPLRRFAVEGLRAFELRFWNPYVHEGVPLALLPVSYPLDLLQALWPTEQGFSALLALHFPLAAVSQFALGRSLGLGRMAAGVGGLVYALGGFALSTLNLYVYAQALAWAPLVVLALIRAGAGGSRSVALAAATTAVALSTTGVEIAVQAVLFGLILAASPRPGSLLRLGGALALAAGLAAVPLVLTSGLLSASERGAGFPTDVVLAHSVHPMTLVQTLIAGLYGDPSRGADLFWGQNFFPRGFPYFLSLYLGATVLALAVAGAMRPGPMRRRLIGLTILGGLVSLGPWGGLQGLVEALPPLHRLRYPSKAFFTVHLAVALLVARGTDWLAGADGDGRRWRSFTAVGGGLGAALLAMTALPGLFPRPSQWFLLRFFPPDAPWEARVFWAGEILKDAARGGLVALVAGLFGLAVMGRRLGPGAGAAAVGVLAISDLLRAGAGINPMVTTAFFRLSPEMAEQSGSLRQAGRIFTCDVGQSPAYLAARQARPDHEAWSFAVLRETLTPNLNLRSGVPSALSLDLTMLVPLRRVLAPDLAGCRDPERLVPRLKSVGVAHLLALDALEHPGLELVAVRAPRDIAPLRVHVYRVAEPSPLWALAPLPGSTLPEDPPPGRVTLLRRQAGRLELRVQSEMPAVLVVREGYDGGWSARVDGRPVRVERTAEDHQSVVVARGQSHVVFTYRPEGLTRGLLISAISSLVLLGLVFWPRRRVVAAPGDSSP